jgi:hypothetical protein
MVDNYYYSQITNSFYPKEFKKNYVLAGSWPTDAILVSYESFKIFSGSPPHGMSRGSGIDGYPCWVEKANTTESENRNIETSWVSQEMLRVRDEIEKLQDSDSSANGTISDWRVYRKSLRSWAEHHNFPNKEFRPKAPDFKE